MRIIRWVRCCIGLSRASKSHKRTSREISTSVFNWTLGFSEPIEAYTFGGFHPIHLHDVLKERYRVLRKVGHGRFATVWLAQDALTSQYVALKVKSATFESNPQHEANLLKALEARDLTISLIDSFEVQGPNGDHSVLVLQPLSRTLGELIEVSARDIQRGPFRIPTNTYRSLAKKMVEAVDCIHSQRIMHRDIQPGNFVFALKSSIDKMDEKELEQPMTSQFGSYIVPVQGQSIASSLSSKRKDQSRPAYLVETAPLEEDPRNLLPERLLLADFGSATAFSKAQDGGQTYPLDARTPEEVLELPITPSADIWALGCTIFHLVTMTPMFYVGTFSTDEEARDEYLLSMAEVLGGMPKNLFERWEHRADYLDDNGSVLADPRHGSVSDPLSVMIERDKPYDMSVEDSLLFEQFLRLIFQWQSEHRPTARQLLLHPWLKDDGV